MENSFIAVEIDNCSLMSKKLETGKSVTPSSREVSETIQNFSPLRMCTIHHRLLIKKIRNTDKVYCINYTEDYCWRMAQNFNSLQTLRILPLLNIKFNEQNSGFISMLNIQRT